MKRNILKVENKSLEEMCNFRYKDVWMEIKETDSEIVIWNIISLNEGKGEVQDAFKELISREKEILVAGTIHPAVSHICKKLEIGFLV